MRFQEIGPLVIVAITATGVMANGKVQTLTVSDSMCGAKHMMPGQAADCARACVGKGSHYALVVGDKVYTVHASDKTAQDELNKLAGQKATVTGTTDGDTLEVSKITAAK